MTAAENEPVAMLEEPVVVRDMRDGMSLHDNSNVTRKDGEQIIAHIDAILALAKPAADRGAAMGERIVATQQPVVSPVNAERVHSEPVALATTSGGQEGATPRRGSERLESTRTNADFWLAWACKEDDHSKALMYAEQSVNAWKNAAYGLAEELAAPRSGGSE